MASSRSNARPARTIAPTNAALQHGPRPLPLFLQIMMQQCGEDAAQMQRVLRGLKAFQTFKRPPRPAAMPEIARVGRACVMDYGGNGRPVLFVPSLINPPYVLDLSEQFSLVRWLATQGFRVLLIDWGDPQDGGSDLSIAGHIETYLLPFMETIGRDAALVGYCLGGTIAMGAAALRPTAGLITIAAPWNFDGYPPETKEQFARLWQEEKPAVTALGLFPMEMLQMGFWQLDPARTIAKYAKFGEMDPASPTTAQFVTLEDWANEGPPLTVATARELFEQFFGENVCGSGRWKVNNTQINMDMIAAPVFNIISTIDKIVPQTASPDIGTKLILDRGHVGMVVGSQAKTELWEPIAVWLSRLGDR